MAQVANVDIRRGCALGSSNRAGIYDLRIRCRDGWIRIYGTVRRVTLRSSFRCLAGSDCRLSPLLANHSDGEDACIRLQATGWGTLWLLEADSCKCF